MSDMAPIADLPEDRTAIEAASDADRRFFEAQPDRNYRVRPARDGEIPGLKTPRAGWAMIAVKQIASGVRASFPFVAADLKPDTDDLARWVIDMHFNQARQANSP